MQGTLLSTAVSKSARLDEFEQTQNTTIAAFAALLKDTWSVAVRAAVWRQRVCWCGVTRSMWCDVERAQQFS